ncbi:MAG: AraC family transcriptional regulator [Oscillospiraceae bacterium]
MKYLAFHENLPRGSFNFPVEFYNVDANHPRYFMDFHWHMQYEFILISKGSFTLNIDDKIFEMQAGDAAFITDGTIHGGTPHDCVYECIVFDLLSLLGNNSLCNYKLGEILNHSNQIQSVHKKGSRISNVIQQLFLNIEGEFPGCEFTITGLLWQFFGIVLNEKLYAPSDKSDLQHTYQIKKVLQRIREDYKEPLTLSMLAAESDLSPKYFCRAFYQIIGRTPIDYLNYYRIECAGEKLLTTDESVTDIALSCGFNDLSYFIKTFKKRKNISPKKYRSRSS